MTGHLWVLGDSWADPSTFPWAPEQGWPQLLAARLRLAVVNSGASGSGFVRPGALDSTIPNAAARGAGRGAAAVLIFGGVNDADTGHPPADIAAGATVALGLLRRACPRAPLLLAGPQWGSTPPPARLTAARDALAVAAAQAGAVFLDPLGWFTGRRELMLDDDYHPTPAGHTLIADRLAPELLWALGQVPPASPPPPAPPAGWPAPWTAGQPAQPLPDPDLEPALEEAP